MRKISRHSRYLRTFRRLKLDGGHKICERAWECILRPFGGFRFHCHKNGIDRTAGEMPVQFRCALRGTIFMQAAHRICKPGQAGGGNGIGGEYFPVTETALRRKRKGLTSPFSCSEKTWIAGEPAIICLHGGLRLCRPAGC